MAAQHTSLLDTWCPDLLKYLCSLWKKWGAGYSISPSFFLKTFYLDLPKDLSFKARHDPSWDMPVIPYLGG
jgi:hypothetical protein